MTKKYQFPAPPAVDPGPADVAGDPADNMGDYLARAISGNPYLITRPHLVSALMNANATPQQMRAIGIFGDSLRAATRVNQAYQAGAKITMSSQEQAAAQALGVDPSGVQYTQADLLAALDRSQGVNKKEGWWDQGVVHGLERAGYDALHNPVTNAISKPLNYVTAAFSGNADPQNYQYTQEAMKAAGYDPNSWFSRQAYLASGIALGDVNHLSDLYKGHDATKVDEAIKYANDPQAYMKSIATDTSLTVAQRGQKISALSQDKDFEGLVRQVISKNASWGYEIARDVGIDPIKHPNWFGATAGALDFVSSIALDPTIVGGKLAKIAKMTQVGLDTIDHLASGPKLTRILVDGKGGAWGMGLRKNMTDLLDTAEVIRKARTDNKPAQEAKAYEALRLRNPQLVHLLPDFLGEHQAIDYTENGKLLAGGGDPITTLPEAAIYLSSKFGMVRLFNGRPAQATTLIPGAMSPWGLRVVKARLAGWQAGSDVQRRVTRMAALDLNKEGVAAKFLPPDGLGADEAVAAAEAGDITGTGLKSASRDILGNPVAYAQDLFDSRKGLAGTWQRTKLLAQRWNSFLPENTVFNTENFNGPEQVYRYGLMYLTKGDAALTAARYAAGNEGVRKSILTALHLQTLHAAGFGASAAGSNVIKAEGARTRLERAELALKDEKYSNTAGPILDPATGVERDAALWPQDMQDTMLMTKFSDLQKYAAKIGIWEKTLGTAFTHPLADHVMKVVRMGWQLTVSNILRNAGEDLFHAYTRGELADVLRTKITARQAGLLPNANSANVANFALGKLGSKSERAAKLVRSTAHLTYYPVARLGQLYKWGMLKTSSKLLGLGYVAKLDPEILRQFAEDYMNLHVGSMLDPAGVDQLDEILHAGFKAGKIDFRMGYESVPTDGAEGATSLRNHLKDKVEANKELAKLLMDHLENPAGTPLRTIVDSLLSDRKVTKSIRANRFVNDSGETVEVTPKSVDPVRHVADREIAIKQMAQQLRTEMKYLLSGSATGQIGEGALAGAEAPGFPPAAWRENPDQQPTFNWKLWHWFRENDYKAPSEDWIVDNLVKGDFRPPTVLRPKYAALPVDQTKEGWVKTLGDKLGVGYKHIIERNIAKMSSLPIFLHNYGEERVFLKGWEDQLVKDGFAPEVADVRAREMAMDRAWKRTTLQIDDPTTRTQMDFVGRNFFAYSRATRAFIRRWGKTFVEDPVRLRKAMLALEAGQNTGLVFTDVNGQRQVSFPGSAAAMDSLMKVMDLIPGVDLNTNLFGDVSAGYTGRFDLLSPGLQNPLQMSLTPMVNIPMRWIFNLFPQHKLALDQIDGFFNGQQSAKSAWYQELMPTAVKKFTDALNGDDLEGLLASSQRAAIYNMDAAGLIPANDADPAVKQVFLDRLRGHTKGQLWLRAMFSLFSPTPLGEPSQATPGSQSDWMYGAMGLPGLTDEFRQLMNDTGGDYGTATQMWAAMHPDKMFVTVGTTTGVKSANVNPTAAAEGWMQHNLDFMKSYQGVAAYFVPKNLQQGNFDVGAWGAELQLGVRQHKTLSQFYDDVVNANASTDYFALAGWRDAAIQAQPWLKDQVMAQFEQKKALLFAQYPVFAATQADYSAARQTASGQVETLRNMVAQPATVPKDVPVTVVRQMLAAYDAYHNGVSDNQGGGQVATYHRAELAGMYRSTMVDLLVQTPALAGLYSGVFRTLDPQVLDPLGSTS